MNIKEWLDIAETAKKIIDRNTNSIAYRLISNDKRKRAKKSAEEILKIALTELIYTGYPAYIDYEECEYHLWIGDYEMTLKAEGELFRRDFKKYLQASGMADKQQEENKNETPGENAPVNPALSDEPGLPAQPKDEPDEDVEEIEDIDLSNVPVTDEKAQEAPKEKGMDKIPAEEKRGRETAPEGQTGAVPAKEAPPAVPGYDDSLGDDDTRLLTTRKTPVKQAEKKEPGLSAGGYADHLHKKDITFGYHKIAIKQNDSSLSHHAEIIVSPISMDKENPGLIAWISDGLHSEVRVSDNVIRPTSNINTVLLQTADIPVVVGGTIKDGKFESFVKTTKRMEASGISIEGTSEFYGGTGHIRLEDDGIDIRIVPLSSTNGSAGNAEYFYCIMEKGKDPVCGDNVKEKNVLFDYKGNKMELVAKWSNEVLYSTARPL